MGPTGRQGRYRLASLVAKEPTSTGLRSCLFG
jgi:hypothetical protein